MTDALTGRFNENKQANGFSLPEDYKDRLARIQSENNRYAGMIYGDLLCASHQPVHYTRKLEVVDERCPAEAAQARTIRLQPRLSNVA